MQAVKKKSYVKVSNEQRDFLIDLLSQNEQISITEAANLVGINYESAKSIWNIFRKHGRKHNLKSKAQKHQKDAKIQKL